MDLLGWLIFLVALLFSVGLHELGHFATAKKFGMKATRFFIGMGPTVWSWTRGETEYGIKAFPIGGFVKIIGMTSMEDVDPADEPRTLRRKPAWQRVIVLSAGSFMHFVLALVLLFGLALTLGIENDNTTQLGTISACVPASQHALTTGQCTAADPKSPASLAGLKVGDKVTSFDGARVSSYTDLATAIKHVKAGASVPITVQRDGRTLTLHATLASVQGRSGGFLGIAGSQVFEQAGPLRAVTFAGGSFGQVVVSYAQALGQIPSALPYLFAKNRASTPAGNLSSVVGDANVTGQVLNASALGWRPKVELIVMLIASLNIVVGVFNLFPLLPMDGGHIFAVFLERIRSRYARWRRRPDPGLIDYTKLLPVSFCLFAVIVALGVTLILADIVNPVSLG